MDTGKPLGSGLREAAGLEHYPVEDGCLVYQPDRDRVHFLNETAYAVLLLCDSGSDAESLARRLAREYQLEEPPVEMVQEVLERLAGEGLITFP
jgi:PqqD family protein of HPr-rel-A system